MFCSFWGDFQVKHSWIFQGFSCHMCYPQEVRPKKGSWSIPSRSRNFTYRRSIFRKHRLLGYFWICLSNFGGGYDLNTGRGPCPAMGSMGDVLMFGRHLEPRHPLGHLLVSGSNVCPARLERWSKTGPKKPPPFWVRKFLDDFVVRYTHDRSMENWYIYHLFAMNMQPFM